MSDPSLKFDDDYFEAFPALLFSWSASQADRTVGHQWPKKAIIYFSLTLVLHTFVGPIIQEQVVDILRGKGFTNSFS